MPISEQTVIRVLLHLRAQIIRDDEAGLEHVEALLRLRGIDPDAHHVRRKQDRNFGRGKLQRAILRALRDGPRTGPQIVAALAAENGLARVEVRSVVKARLSQMRAQGMLQREKGRAGRYALGLAN